eukprot:PhM_4_TR12862/c0_g1_i1/m.24722
MFRLLTYIVLAAFGISSVWAATLTAYYPLDGTLSESMEHRDGYLAGTGMSTFAPGQYGRCLVLKGNRYVNLYASSDFVPSGDFTAALWFKTNVYLINDETTGQRMLTVYRDADGVSTKFAMYLTKSGSSFQVVCMIHTGMGFRRLVYTPTSSPANDNAWHHLGCVVNDANMEVYLYYDGSRVSSMGLQSPVSASGAARAQLGTWYNSGYWVGSLDEVRVYNGVVDATQMHRIFMNDITSSASPTPAPRLVRAQYSLEGTTVDSISSTAATLTGKQKFITGGAVGRGMEFDGATYLTGVSTSSMFPVESSFSVMGYFRTGSFPDMLTEPDGRRMVSLYAMDGVSSRTSLGVYVDTKNEAYVACYLGLSGGNFERLAYKYYFADNQWHHLVCTYNITDRVAALFLDGRRVVKNELTQSQGLIAPAGNAGLTIGAVSGRSFWFGSIDEVIVYGTALIPEEVYNITRRGALSNTAAQWPTYTATVQGTTAYADLVTNTSNEAALAAHVAHLCPASASTSDVTFTSLCAVGRTGTIAASCLSTAELAVAQPAVKSFSGDATGAVLRLEVRTLKEMSGCTLALESSDAPLGATIREVATQAAAAPPVVIVVGSIANGATEIVFPVISLVALLLFSFALVN